jgi:hypothetical protein
VYAAVRSRTAPSRSRSPVCSPADSAAIDTGCGGLAGSGAAGPVADGDPGVARGGAVVGSEEPRDGPGDAGARPVDPLEHPASRRSAPTAPATRTADPRTTIGAPGKGTSTVRVGRWGLREPVLRSDA